MRKNLQSCSSIANNLQVVFILLPQAITVANRSDYQISLNVLQQFQEAGYETDITEFTEQLKEMNKRRTALHEELRGIKWNK